MRRLITLTAALAVSMAVAAPVVAQDTAEGEEPAAVGTASTIGLDWQRVELPNAGPFLWVYDIIPVGPRFIAVGGGTRVSPKSRARVWTSKNGRRWQSVPLKGSVGHGTPRAITRTPGGGFVMVGQGRCVMPCAMAWRSPDGVSWERLPEAIRESMLYDVAVFGDRLVAVGCHTPGFHCLAGRVWVSDDEGATWEQVAEVPEIMFHALEAVDGQLVATGDTDGFDTAEGITATSTDGVTWTIHDHSDGLGWMRAAGRQRGRALVGGGDHAPSGAKVAATLLASRDDGKFEPSNPRASTRASSWTWPRPGRRSCSAACSTASGASSRTPS
jgi:hypothetical protein